MYRFDVYSGELLIGWSELESGDPPMGVAFGKFIPAPDYEAVRSAAVELENEERGVPHLSIRLSDGTVLRSAGGVHITDHSVELGENGREIAVLGIEYPLYKELFPHHVDAYERKF
ncbi:hypothetical protein [Dyella mobilis]|uniref:Uncharacterized protein n=1 Tax=Dyella mobilis TaxID=1849582 RepID=A0ABS2KCA6_9GAMM|nr:hypothetical protein [Dyella mobilis]MBM7128820.1 hypothetical protein [Dyella mobilis]GLQ99152.1 hypothetical protein GCM10007863_35720 [Dyella mobilis]